MIPHIDTLLGSLKSAVKARPHLHALLLPMANVVRGFAARARSRGVNRFRRICTEVSHLAAAPVFVKVGANDGVTGDPCSDILLQHRVWKGLLIEPVPYCFARLQANFADASRFRLEQIAIGAEEGERSFYFVDAAARAAIPGLPDYFDQLGSFDRRHILRHLDGALEPHIVESRVEVCTLSRMMERHGITNVHLLHVDVEGHDYEVFRTLDLAQVRPLMIYIEHKHLDSASRAAMLQTMRRHGYSVEDCGADFFALDRAGYRRLRSEGAYRGLGMSISR